MRRLAREHDLGDGTIRSYRIERPALPHTYPTKRASAVAALIAPPGNYHVIVGRHTGSPRMEPQISVLIAKEVSGQIVSFRHLVSR